jgi:hypothetical protein
MSQINPFRGVVIPSTRPQGVLVQKDRQQQRRSPQREPEGADDEQTENGILDDDGNPHVDLKA